MLVVDAMTGQEAATLASVFNEKIGITGAVLTKMDGDTRGGAALSVQVGVYPARPVAIDFCSIAVTITAPGARVQGAVSYARSNL